MDYENKLSRFHLPFQQLEEEKSNLLQKLKEKEIENSILTENLKQKQMEILGLRKKIDNIEQTRSTLHQEKINHSHLNKNHDNTAKQSESKNSGIMPNEKQSKKKETPLKVVFNQANKKISPIYKMANSSFALKKNSGKKKVPGNENSSFNGGCVYPTNNKVISATSFRKSTSATSPTEKRNLEPRDNENEPPVKKGLPHFYSPINSQETDDEKSKRKRPLKKRALFSHSKFETEEEVLLDDDLNNE
ncbi:uncharacterized protein LOC123296312 [Chrysoperla carnea]|uniref:uncharacterized protein LOC123296312 n=1 Tax=Chrysoperla carnea TaxID=189513 RepID=UPI001D0613B3|nr:uncharacterized protein LOC123296312 [Chrysoperla carnea]